jgi:hypothetical protein
LAITSLLELRTVGRCIAEILTQLAAWILPPIALPRALPTITKEGVFEATVIKFGASKLVASAAGLVRMPATIEAALTAARIAKGLALRNKG